jgi:hypothetical protein
VKLKASHPSFPFSLHLISLLPGRRNFIWRCTLISWGGSSAHIFGRSSMSPPDLDSRPIAGAWQDMLEYYICCDRARLTLIQESDFWGDNTTNRTARRLAPITSSSTPSPRWHNLLNFLHFTHQPVKTSQPIPLHPRRWNFSLFTRPGRIPTQTIDVASARDEDVSRSLSLTFVSFQSH